MLLLLFAAQQAGLTWPAGLPQYVLVDGWKGSDPGNVIRSEVDSGTAIERRRDRFACRGGLLGDGMAQQVEDTKPLTNLDKLVSGELIDHRTGISVISGLNASEIPLDVALKLVLDPVKLLVELGGRAFVFHRHTCCSAPARPEVQLPVPPCSSRPAIHMHPAAGPALVQSQSADRKQRAGPVEHLARGMPDHLNIRRTPVEVLTILGAADRPVVVHRSIPAGDRGRPEMAPDRLQHRQ
jgi:hypothetical protein